MQGKNPFRHHTPDDDPETGTPGTGEDVCPECHGTGKVLDKTTGKPTEATCERCDGTGKIIEGIG
jgi:DnaJ-class molecular chaperone